MTYHPDDPTLAAATTPRLPTQASLPPEDFYINQQDKPEHAILWPPKPLIQLNDPETPLPVVPVGYMVMTERQHFELTQQANKAKAEEMFGKLLAPGHHTDYQNTVAQLALVMSEIEETGKGLAQVRRLRVEAERTARQRRQIGRLATRSEVRRELGEIYRESYGTTPDEARHFTRLAYMLDLLARLATDERKPPRRGKPARDKTVNNTGQSEAE